VTDVTNCHEEVSRNGYCEPCDKTAVAIRRDPNGGKPYPVCKHHTRGDMVPLANLAETFATAAIGLLSAERSEHA
jgi:hypothetical protein